MAIKFSANDQFHKVKIFRPRELEDCGRPDEMYVEFDKKYVTCDVGESVVVEVKFVLERQLFQNMRKAVSRIEDMHLLFPPCNPNVSTTTAPAVPPDGSEFGYRPEGSSNRLDKWQECAAEFMRKRGGSDDTTPILLLYGRFGSGKTHTLAHTTMDILERNQDEPKILICTHSNR